MAVPYIFASTLGGSNIPLQWLDDDFAYLTSSPSFSGNVTITGTLGVGGAVNFSSTLNVAGITTLSNDLSVAGSSSFTGGATFSSSVTFDSKTITGTTGAGDFVLSVSPTVTSATLVAPALGTPTSGDLVNCTNLPLSSVTGLGSGVGNFLAIPSSANLAAAVTGETGTGELVFGTNPVLVTPNIGTPSAGVLTNCTGLPVTSGISGLGANVDAFLATPTSANLASAVIDETGFGGLVFNTNPQLINPNLGTPSVCILTNGTGLPLTNGYGVTGVLPVANGGTGISSLTTGYIPFGGATTFSSNSKLFWDNSGERLGIGTSVPVYKLDIAGDLRVQKAAGAGWGIVTNTNGFANESGFYTDSSENFEMVVRDASGDLTGCIKSAADSFVNTITGNFGIGTSVPIYRLDVAGDIRAQRAGEGWGLVTKTTVSNESGVYFDSLNNAILIARDGAGTEQVRWHSDGDTYGNLVDGKPAFVCRAWVNFDGTSNAANLSGTYSQSGFTVTVTATAHGLVYGNAIYASITTGTAVSGLYNVATVIDANTFTYTAGTSLTTNGNITLVRSTIRGSGNVTSVTDFATGQYRVNLTTALPDANAAVVSSCEITGNFQENTNSWMITTVEAGVETRNGNTLTDAQFISVAIFR